MILSMLAAAAAATAPVGPAKVEPPPTHIDWWKVPSGDDIAEYYPDAAAQAEISGRVTIGCRVTPSGSLEGCIVLFEDPPGLYFGAAALKMSKKFAMTPQTAASAPPVINIPIRFIMTGRNAAYGSEANTVVKPLWSAAPTYDQVLAAFARPIGGGASVFDCNITADGALDQCLTVPAHSRDDANAAARPLLQHFRVRVDPAWRIAGQPLRVNVPIKPLDAAALGADRPIAEPAWVAIPDADVIAAAYPAAAAAKGVATGKGTARCIVAGDGSLRDCSVAAETPEGLGFGQAAVRIAEGMKMNLWTPSGEPVIGATIRLPIRFEQPAPAPAQP
jgi:TonB family protein